MAKKNNLNNPPTKRSKRFQVNNHIKTIDYELKRPVFSLKYMRYGCVCCVSKCQKNERSVILERLLRLSQLEWKDIHSEPKDGMGYEPIPQDRFKNKFPTTVTPEVSILVFRYSASGRIAGFRENDIYHIVMVGSDLYSH